jgi:ATP-dependent Zn protease
MNTKEISTAYHEAGHAVAHVKLHRPFRSVSIKKRWQDNGRVNCDPDSDIEDKLHRPDTDKKKLKWLCKREIMINEAGANAELISNSMNINSCMGSMSDFEDTRYMQDLAGFSEEDLESIQEEAMALIENNWHLVEAVAEALLEHKSLKNRQVRNIIKEASLAEAV